MTEAKRPRREFRLPKWALWAVLALIAAAAGLHGVAWIVVRPEADIEHASVRLRARGLATTVAEWNDPPVLAEENGGVEIDAADEWLVALHGSRDAWRAAGPWRNDLPERWWEAASPEDLLALDHFLAALEPYFRRVDAALARPRLHWPADAQFSLPEVGRLQRLSSLLAASARRDADPEHRLRAIGIPLRIARRLERPVLIQGLVVGGMSARAARDLRDLVESGEVPASAAWRELAADLRVDLSSRLPELARAELVFCLETHREVYAGRVPTDDGLITVHRIRNSGQRVAALFIGGPAAMFEVCEEVIGVDEARLADRLRRYRAIEASACLYARIAAVAWPNLARKLGSTDAALRLARVALAVTGRHETTGRWPAALDEIRDAFPEGVPQDPFTDAPFAYEVRADVVRIASAGHIAGDPAPSAEELRDRALVWEFPRR